MSDASQRHVVIVGAGIIGASIAWHTLRTGARITIVDAQEPGGVATPCSFGWVNSTYGFPRTYFDLRSAAMKAWRDMLVEIPDLPYATTGTVYLHLDGHDGEPVDLPAFAHGHMDWGYDIEVVGGNALRTRAPNVRDLPQSGLWAPCEGAAEGTDVARFCVQECINGGATVINGTPVMGLLTKGGRVNGVETALGPLVADDVVVAAGVATSGLIEDVATEIPLKMPPGILIHTEPHAPLIPHITLTKHLHIRQRADGRILAGWDFGGGSGPDDPDTAAAGLMARIKETFVGADAVRLAHVTVGHRPTPLDGFPVVGRPGGTPGLTVAVMHSGVTLAPLIGKAVADFIGTGTMDPLLSPYGPERFETSPRDKL